MYKELIQSLQTCAACELEECIPNCGRNEPDYDLVSIAYAMEEMNARIAALRSENAELRSALSRVEAERDAAMAEIPHVCRTCKHKPQKYGVCGMGCEVDPLTIHHAERCNWEWRGAQGEG